METRDLMRSRLVGRKVGVTVEYEKVSAGTGAQSGSAQKRVFATVKVMTGKEMQGEGKNVALMLVSEGLATCVKHRDGEEKSSEYDSYLMAEAESASKGLCLHGSAPPPSSLTSASHARLQDLTIGTDCKFFFTYTYCTSCYLLRSFICSLYLLRDAAVLDYLIISSPIFSQIFRIPFNAIPIILYSFLQCILFLPSP